MKPVKRVEIVVAEVIVPRLREVMDKAGIRSFTIIPQAAGRGDRGDRAGDELTGVFDNVVVLIACDEEAVARLEKPLGKLLGTYGGMCLVSDAVYLEHGAGR